MNNAPVMQLKTKRGLLKMFLLTLITFGIYPLVMMTILSGEINMVASKYDGKKTMNYCLMAFIITPITFGIGSIVWYHRYCNRVGRELCRRGIAYSFSAADYWIWSLVGLFFAIGPLVFYHKLLKATNLINADYNIRG